MGEAAIFFYCGALVGLVRYGLGRTMKVEPRGQTGWRAAFDGAASLRPRRMNLWFGLVSLAVAVLLTALWLVQR